MSLTLRRLTTLEETKLSQELDDLRVKISRCNTLLSSPFEINEVIVEESLQLKQKYAMPRKSVLMAGVDSAIDDKDLIPNDR